MYFQIYLITLYTQLQWMTLDFFIQLHLQNTVSTEQNLELMTKLLSLQEINNGVEW